eukprot:TRINITY_DN5302_c0_g2_i1.p1 TRINITY_DN5302_c0_g2~~TRINITY_DN5302_c0_g2_i1.p1  ORF type:complete len:165 (-),score=44.50 TRINITY_DN5302_c0_g2_i1:320-814(-)
MRSARLPAAVAATVVAAAAAITVEATGAGDAFYCPITIVGGGIGGAYTAWRLAVDAKVVRPADVCLFEANARLGGRIFSVGNVPGYEGFVTDVGAYRFHRANHPLIRSLVEDRLQMETGCYTDATAVVPMDTPACPAAPTLCATTRTRSYLGNFSAPTGYQLDE